MEISCILFATEQSSNNRQGWGRVSENLPIIHFSDCFSLRIALNQSHQLSPSLTISGLLACLLENGFCNAIDWSLLAYQSNPWCRICIDYNTSLIESKPNRETRVPSLLETRHFSNQTFLNLLTWHHELPLTFFLPIAKQPPITSNLFPTYNAPARYHPTKPRFSHLKCKIRPYRDVHDSSTGKAPAGLL